MLNDVKVFECFKLLIKNLTCLHHSFIILSSEDAENDVILLSLKCVTPYFSAKKPFLLQYKLAVKEEIYYDLIYDNRERDIYVLIYHSQDSITQERVNSDEMGFKSLEFCSILEVILRRIYSDRRYNPIGSLRISLAPICSICVWYTFTVI